MEKLRFHRQMPIEKGWSGDRKYKATDENGRAVLLRISPAERKDGRQKLFAQVRRLPEDIPMSRPIEFGLCDEGVYTTWDWIEGEDAEAVVPTLPEKEQYVLGYRAGEILRQIHVLPAPQTLEPWGVRFGRKIDRKLAQYRACPVHYPDGEKIIRFVEEKRRQIAGRPQCFQHGDYHIGNMMLEDGELKIIDFDRYDFGDPWEEFSRIVWCAQAAPAFAVGQIDGYFDGRPPEQFFCLLALYIAVNTVSSLPWAMPFGQEQIDIFMAQEQEIMDWYDGFSQVVPKWYREYKDR